MDARTRDASSLAQRAREDIEGAEDKASRRRTPSEVVHVDSNGDPRVPSSGVGSGVALHVKKTRTPFFGLRTRQKVTTRLTSPPGTGQSWP